MSDYPMRTARWDQDASVTPIKDGSGKVVKRSVQPEIHIEVMWINGATRDAITELDYAYRQVRAQIADDPGTRTP